MQRKERKRILFLSLGTGRSDKNNEGVKKISYRKTQYTFDGVCYKKNNKEKKTNFVAEPLIDIFKPDIIVFLGTVKSVWDQFYASLTSVDNNDNSYLEDPDYLELYRKEQQYDHAASSDDIKTFETRINAIFSSVSGEKWGKYSEKYDGKKPETHILLTKYGINSDEIQENYRIIKRIEEYLDPDAAYEVAFDITHSFRSLPLYNLIILNYIKNISGYDLIISHIYYGNLEAKHELNEQAPIVDLKELVEVLDLTGGVTEFKDTGNAITLLTLIEGDEELKKALNEFDLSMQINAFDRIVESLNHLKEILKNKGQKDKYNGLREMISVVLREKFYGSFDETIFDREDVDSTELKFMLSAWYFDQNRMGLGLATGLEALRDLNTPVFMEVRNVKGAERNQRESAEKFFIDMAKKYKEREESFSELEKAFVFLGTNLQHFKDMRNTFAHNLVISGDEAIDDNTFLKDIKEEIKGFKENLLILKKEYNKDPNAYRLFFESPKTDTGNKKQKTQSKCRIVLQFSGDTDINELYGFRDTAKYSYAVYYLHQDVQRWFFSGKEDDGVRAFYMKKYLKEQIPEEYEEVSLIFYKCDNPVREVIYRIQLEQLMWEDKRIVLEQVKGDGDNTLINKYKGLNIEAKPKDQNKIEKKELDFELKRDIPLIEFKGPQE